MSPGRRALALVLLAGSVASAACSTEGAAEEDAESDEAQLSTAKNILYLNFDGSEIQPPLPPFYGEQTEPFPVAYQVERETSLGPWDAKFFAPSMARKTVIKRIADRVRTILAPYDITVVTRKPSSSRKYAMLVLPAKGAEQLRSTSGTGLSTLYGISTIDCGNENHQAVGFVFPDAIPLNEQPTPQKAIEAIAAVAAHELGHTLGLKDTQNEADVMYPYGGTAGSYGPRADVEDVNGHAFEICGSERTQDSHAMVLAALGARPAASP